MIYTFIQSHRYRWSVGMMCRVLGSSRNSYYNWLNYPAGKRMKRRLEMKASILRCYELSKGRKGSPRIQRYLEAQGIKLSCKTISNYMQQMGLKSKLYRRYRPVTNSSHKTEQPVAENLLNYKFISPCPGVKCVSDITYIPTSEVFLYLTTVINRDVIGWSISENMNAKETVIPAKQSSTECKL